MSQLPTLLDNIKFEHPGFTLPFARLDPEVVFDLGELWFSGSLATHAQAICVLRALNHPPKNDLVSRGETRSLALRSG
jgi:hypothetical protein